MVRKHSEQTSSTFTFARWQHHALALAVVPRTAADKPPSRNQSLS